MAGSVLLIPGPWPSAFARAEFPALRRTSPEPLA